MIKEVDILGENYTVKITTAKENPALKGSYGMCDSFIREIEVDKTYSNGDEMPKRHLHLAIRHEVVHAFLTESGFQIKHDEDLINWIAMMFPRMSKVFEQLQATE